MKYIIYPLLSLLIISCTNKNKDITTIEAKLKIDPKDQYLVQNEPYNRIGIYDANSITNIAIDTLKINQKGIVNDTISIKKEGLYIMSIGLNQTEIYLKKGSSLKFTAEYFNLNKTLKFEGDLADVNTFFTKNSIEVDSLFLEADNWIALDENDFLKKIAAVRNKINTIIDSNSKGINDTIVANTKIDAKYFTSKLYLTYLYKHRYYFDREYSPSQKMLNYIRNYDFNNAENLKKSRIYREIVYQYYWDEYQKTIYKSVVPAVKGFDNFLIKLNINNQLKDYLLTYRVIKVDMKPESKEKNEAMNYLKEHVKSKFYLDELEKILSQTN